MPGERRRCSRGSPPAPGTSGTSWPAATPRWPASPVGRVGISADDAEIEAGKAMRLLRRALAEGYRDTAGMASEVALDPLRTRPEVQLLMLDLAFPADPFVVGR